MAGAGLAPAATDYSYIKNGNYTGTGRTPAFQTGTATFPAGSYAVSFRVSSAKRKGPRTMRTLKLGPVTTLCTNTKQIPTRYMQRAFPRLSGFPPAAIPGGFIVRSFVLRGGHWKPTKSGTSYDGPLPHVDLGLVYNRSPTRFNPNPLSSPSVTYKVRVDDAGKPSTAGAWDCSAASPVTLRKR